jgi:hypothetical protein
MPDHAPPPTHARPLKLSACPPNACLSLLGLNNLNQARQSTRRSSRGRFATLLMLNASDKTASQPASH